MAAVPYTRGQTLSLTDNIAAPTATQQNARINGASGFRLNTFKMPVGGTHGDGVVNSGDAPQTRNRSGQVTDGTNLLSDVNMDDVINIGDTFTARARSRTFVP